MGCSWRLSTRGFPSSPRASSRAPANQMQSRTSPQAPALGCDRPRLRRCLHHGSQGRAMGLQPANNGKRSAVSGPGPVTAMSTGSGEAGTVTLESDAPRIAVLVPCHNEEASVGKVVADFRAALPRATVYVY